MAVDVTRLSRLQWRNWPKRIWFFPALIVIIMLSLSLFQISGSSIGNYYKFFYGPGAHDPNLLANHPQGIRSDEWLVNSQLTIAQKNAGYPRINPNIGQGEDMSVIGDTPYKDWSVLFKPHNLVFFALPFNTAFALNWWLMGGLLIVGCYCFMVELLPRRWLFAALISLGLFFNPFVQWWYINGTLSTLAFSFWMAFSFMKLLGSSRTRAALIWSALLSYSAVTFALILYPPFQIPCALATAAFGLGYLLDQGRGKPRQWWQQKLGFSALALAVAGLIVLTFFHTRANVVKTIKETAYPGKRIQTSGGYDIAHLFSGQLDAQLEFKSKAPLYRAPGASNQSEAANFILLLPFLALPSVIVIWQRYRQAKVIDWPLLAVNGVFGLFLAWLYLPGLSLVGKLTQLQIVPHPRLIIGLGVIGIMQLVIFIRSYDSLKGRIKWYWLWPYILAIFLAELALGFYAHHRSPGFITPARIIAYSLPIPIMTYAILRRRYEWAAAFFGLFALLMTFHINPLYRGTAILTDNRLSRAIGQLSNQDHSSWASENLFLENFAAMSAAHSLSGVYYYPQLKLWHQADPTAQDVYNRYAHVVFFFDRNPSQTIPTILQLGAGADSFGVTTEPCGQFIKDQHVKYLLTSTPLDPAESCLTPVEQVSYPAVTAYIYQLRDLQ